MLTLQTILADETVGNSDINLFRVAAALHYIQSCDFTIVVAAIDRVETCPDFRALYRDAYRRRRSKSAILVITRSDDLNIKITSDIQYTSQDEEKLGSIDAKKIALEEAIKSNRVVIEQNRMQGKARLNMGIK